MKYGLWKNGPLAVAINAGKLSPFYKGGIIDGSSCDP